MRNLTITDKNRVETGPTQFNKDWPGVFIRGDNAMYYSMILEEYLIQHSNPKDQEVSYIRLNELKELIKLLNSCIEK